MAVDKAIELLQDRDTKNKWIKKKEKLLTDKIDVTKYLINLVENYI